MLLFSDTSQMTSKCGKNKKQMMAYEAQPSMSLMFLPHFYVFCDLSKYLLGAATWNLIF